MTVLFVHNLYIHPLVDPLVLDFDEALRVQNVRHLDNPLTALHLRLVSFTYIPFSLEVLLGQLILRSFKCFY